MRILLFIALLLFQQLKKNDFFMLSQYSYELYFCKAYLIFQLNHLCLKNLQIAANLICKVLEITCGNFIEKKNGTRVYFFILGYRWRSEK